ncbi:MAG TPA: lytic transglycosylase domain-containing protein [Bdellovibrionota bacterium]|nr:lytic transglycosylase domain-containing protein [Bdellovibrionota bacterium]
MGAIVKGANLFTIVLLIAAVLPSIGRAGSDDYLVLEDSESIRENIARLIHAQELLGKHYYKSVVRAGEDVTSLDEFVLERVAKELPKKFKAKAKRISKAILQESAKHGFDPVFLMAVIKTESRFVVNAKGSMGEIGLMQLKPETAEWLSKENRLKWKGSKSLKDPITNIRLGALYLSWLRGHFDEHSRLYLNAYNMGTTGIHRSLKKSVWPKDYSNRVMKHYVAYYADLKDYSDSLLIVEPVAQTRGPDKPSHSVAVMTRR